MTTPGEPVCHSDDELVRALQESVDTLLRVRSAVSDMPAARRASLHPAFWTLGNLARSHGAVICQMTGRDG